MNKLWYYTAEKEYLWAKLIYYPISYIEHLWYRLKGKLVDTNI